MCEYICIYMYNSFLYVYIVPKIYQVYYKIWKKAKQVKKEPAYNTETIVYLSIYHTCYSECLELCLVQSKCPINLLNK